MEEDRFLIQVYRESGDQVRNISTLRNTFLSFYVIALAAFLGLLAQRSIPVGKFVWLFPFFVSTAGFVSIWLLWRYTHTALRRQELSAQRILRSNPALVTVLDLIPRPNHASLWGEFRTRPGNVRIDLFFLVVYAVVGISSVVFLVWGDPFGLTR